MHSDSGSGYSGVWLLSAQTCAHVLLPRRCLDILSFNTYQCYPLPANQQDWIHKSTGRGTQNTRNSSCDILDPDPPFHWFNASVPSYQKEKKKMLSVLWLYQKHCLWNTVSSTLPTRRIDCSSSISLDPWNSHSPQHLLFFPYCSSSVQFQSEKSTFFAVCVYVCGSRCTLVSFHDSEPTRSLPLQCLA